jgi:hypothetical protein
MRRRSWIWLALAALAGCSSEAASDGTEGAAAIAMSASGTLRINARTVDGEAPIRGDNPFDIEILRADDDVGIEGLQLTLVPWMPAMGHGTSVRPRVTEVGDGHYRADDVYLFMPGLWELRISMMGSIQDNAAPRFQIY